MRRNPPDRPAAEPRLRATRIVVEFGTLTALADVTVDVPARGVVGVIGANGAGKSTLLDVVCGATRLTRGTLQLDGEPLRPKPQNLARLGIGRVVQGLGLPADGTVLDHLLGDASPAPRTGMGAVLRAISRADRADRRGPGAPGADRDHALQLLRELGADGIADDPIETLPRAARVRVAIARATIGSPRLLLLDEPAAGLDADERRDLAALIRRLATRPGRDCSVLLVEHHRDLVDACCDSVVVLDAGAVVATGTPDEIGRDPDLAAGHPDC